MNDILARFQRVSPDSQRQWGTMSVGQMLTHCTDQVRIVLGEKSSKQRGNTFSRWLTKWFALNVPMQMPKNMRTIAELDANKPLMTQPTGEFARDRAELVDAIDRLSNVPDGQRTAHPVFGSLTKAEAINLTRIHLDHHLRQFGA
jgi:hypothetical protein